MRRLLCVFLAALSLLLCGCTTAWETEYSVVEPHTDRYWESVADDILRAGSYQDLVNATLLLVERQEDAGTVRLYQSDVDYNTAWALVRSACAEVRSKTPIGAYSLHALDFSMEQLRNDYYEVKLSPSYRRTAEEIAAIVNIASSGAIYDLVLKAWQDGAAGLTVRYTYLAEDKLTLEENILLLQQELMAPAVEEDTTGDPEVPEAEESTDPAAGDEEPPAAEETATEEEQIPPESGDELPPEEGAAPSDDVPAAPELTPWGINFYPPDSTTGIIEILFHRDAETLHTEDGV